MEKAERKRGAIPPHSTSLSVPPPAARFSHLSKRLFTAIVLIAIVIGATSQGPIALASLLAVGFWLSGWEFFSMAEHAGYRPWTILGVPLLALLLLDGLLPGWRLTELVTLAIVLLPPTFEVLRRSNDGFLSGWALLSLGVLYIGGLGANVFRLALLPDGLQLLGFTLMATWAADSGAYLVGTRWGRHPFLPQISPKKTREGAVGGIAAATFAFAALCLLYGFSPLFSLLGGVGLGLAGTMGDLTESLIKRQFAIKDSGSILAGHGGLLDRLDSTFFTVTFTFYLALLFFTR